ncbi:type 2 lantibiotic [Listeria innocua]|nr:type 2 lantibiotic [Listeria monocytogenes]MBC2140558.1 type 2 lantibiotic [Listeria innocua]
MLLDKVKAALNDSVVYGIFEELDMEQMEILKGAGDVNAKTSPGCITEGIAMGIWVSGKIHFVNRKRRKI